MSAATEKGTISAALVEEALLELRRLGHDAEALLRGVDIDPPALAQPGARVPAALYARLWLASVRVLDDEFFAMNRRRMKPGSFAFMARAALGEASVGAALEGALRFLGLVLDDLDPRLSRCGALAEIVLDEPPGPPPRAFTCFTLWLMIHGLACWLAGQRLPILAIDLRSPAPDYDGDYRVMFGPNLNFSRPRSRLLLDARALDQPVRRGKDELRRFLAGAPANILVRYRDPQSLAMRVRAHLRALAPADWPDLEALARHFHMGASTLRRHLAQEGQTYQSLKDQLRRDLAIAHLDGGEPNFAELAFGLGFADASAFYKAFRKWTGATPGQYRTLIRQRGRHAAIVQTARED